MTASTTTIASARLEEIDFIGGYMTPAAKPVRHFKALTSFIKFAANKEETEHAYALATALAGETTHTLFARFVETENGRRVASGAFKVEELLSDTDYLRTLPESSFGREYVNFMDREGLSVEGLLAARNEGGHSEIATDERFIAMRRMETFLDVSHDLMHVLTGYGRDTLGELCLAGVSAEQSGNPGLRVLAWAGAVVVQLKRPSLPILRAVAQGFHMGRAIAWLPAQDIAALLPLSLEEVRAQVQLFSPSVYDAVPDQEKRSLLEEVAPKTRRAARKFSLSKIWAKFTGAAQSLTAAA